MPIQSIKDLFFHELSTMYDAEMKLAEVLPELARETQNKEVREAFLKHVEETRQHAQNLERCFHILGQIPEATPNHAVAGLRQDHDAFVQQQPAPDVLTLFDINAGTKGEYLEISAYQELIQAANSLGFQQCIPLFQQNLQQEEAAADTLTLLAEKLVMNTQQVV